MLKKFQFFYFFQIFKPSVVFRFNMYFFQKHTLFYSQAIKTIVYLSSNKSLNLINLQFKLLQFSSKLYFYFFCFFTGILVVNELFL